MAPYVMAKGEGSLSRRSADLRKVHHKFEANL
jgi:hypothetical protein